MPDVKFSGLTPAGGLTGTEIVPVVRTAGLPALETTTATIAGLNTASIAAVTASTATNTAAIATANTNIAANTTSINTLNTEVTTLQGQQFIAGVTTSTALIAANSPATSGGRSAQTSDMGLMTCDGTRWLVGPSPPIPVGAALLGFKTNVYTVFPVVADITLSGGALSRLYAGTFLATGTGPSSSFGTASGQLTMSYPAGGPGSQAAAMTTQKNINSQLLPGNLGYLPYLYGGQGFYVEYAFTASTNNTDVFFSPFLEPQELNTTQNNHPPGSPTGFQTWLEHDVNESGHGNDYGGGFRGAFHYWGGWQVGTGGNTTLTAAPTAGNTSGTINTAGAPAGGTVWPLDSQPNWTALTSTGQSLTVTTTNGSSALTWTPAIIGTPTAVLTFRTFNRSSAMTDSTVIDCTVEHIYGYSFDPINSISTWYVDGVAIGSLNFSTWNINAANLTWHYFPIIECDSHGAFVGYTINLRYFSAWTP
jgi:hypothetical protein